MEIHTYILVITDRLGRRANVYAVTATEFTARGPADILNYCYMSMWGCPRTLLSDDGWQFCAQLFAALYEKFKFLTLNTSSYRSAANGGPERVDHVMT